MRCIHRSGLLLCAFVFALLSLAACDKSKAGVSVSSLEPPFGNVAGGDDVVLVGSGYKPGMVVRFGKRKAKLLVIESSSRMKVKTPSGPEGKVDVMVTDDTGKTSVLKEGFTYRSASK